MTPLQRFLLVSLVLLYLMLSLHHLGDVPMVYEDEPWQASTAWKLSQMGVFGSDMFEGWYGMERHCYGFMPLHPIFMAIVFKFLGVGVAQARLDVVFLGLVVLLATFQLAQRLFQDARIGLLAMLFLIGVRLTGTNPSSISGIFFLDMARIARYDMFVPAFGLLALHAFLSASYKQSLRYYALSGVLTGFATLGHVYGVFWLPAFALLLWMTLGLRRAFPPFLSLTLGFSLCCLPYLAYIAIDIEAWRGQSSEYLVEGRLNLLDPSWYLNNLLREPERYKLGILQTTPTHLLMRIGLWSSFILLPTSLWKMARQAKDQAMALLPILIPAVLFPLLFALLIHTKMMNYILSYIPFWAIIIAWGTQQLWDRLSRQKRLGLWLWGSCILFEGTARMLVLEQAATTISPYAQFIEKLRTQIPLGARVMGLPNYWFGLEAVDYHAFVVPAYLAIGHPPLPFDEGMERLHPDIVLIDHRMNTVFENPNTEYGSLSIGFAQWRERHGLLRFGEVEDPSYGAIELWRITR